MSVNELFSPNDLVLYCGQLNTGSGGQVISGNLTVNGNEIVTGNLNVTGQITAVNNSLVQGNFQVNGGEVVLGGLNVTGQITAINNAVVQGNFQSDGYVAIGQALKDHNNSNGTTAQILSSTGTQTLWIDNIREISLQSGSSVAPNNYIGNSSNSANYFDCAYLVSQNMTIVEFNILLAAAAGVGNAYSFTLLKNNIVTAYNTTLNNPVTTATITNSVSFVPGDTFTVIYTVSGVPANPNVTFALKAIIN